MGRRLLIALSILITGGAAYASPETHEIRRVLKDTTNTVTVEMNAKTVRCSSLGYGREELKVSVPDLEFIATLDHSNVGEALPCVTAGKCTIGNMPSDLLKLGSTATTQMRVVLEEVLLLDLRNQKCTRVLEERVSATIQGKSFRHLATADLGELEISICKQMEPR